MATTENDRANPTDHTDQNREQAYEQAYEQARQFLEGEIKRLEALSELLAVVKRMRAWLDSQLDAQLAQDDGEKGEGA